MPRIEADYRDGVLHPTTPVSLRQGEHVQLIVVRKADPRRWDLERLAAGAAEERELAEEGLEAWADELDTLDGR